MSFTVDAVLIPSGKPPAPSPTPPAPTPAPAMASEFLFVAHASHWSRVSSHLARSGATVEREDAAAGAGAQGSRRAVLLRASVAPPTESEACAAGTDCTAVSRFLDKAIGGFTAARSAIAGCFPAAETHADLGALLASPLLRGVQQETARPGCRCRLAVWPKSELAAVGEALCQRGGVAFHPVEFSHVVSVVRLGGGAGAGGGGGRLSLAVLPRAAVHDRVVAMAAMAAPAAPAVALVPHCPCPPGGVEVEANAGNAGNAAAAVAAICRAQHKLEELRVRSGEFDGLLRRAAAAADAAAGAAAADGAATGAAGRKAAGQDGRSTDAAAAQQQLLTALDVGASPGGWTWYLAQHPFARVFAVDPGALAPAVAAAPNVTHLQEWVQAVDWAAQHGGAAATAGGARTGSSSSSTAAALPGFSLLTCDMNGMDCRDEMRLLLGLAPLVRAGGLLVVTLKLPAKVSEAHAAKLQGECVAILEGGSGGSGSGGGGGGVDGGSTGVGGGGAFRVCGSYWLLANRNSERTLVAVTREVL